MCSKMVINLTSWFNDSMRQQLEVLSVAFYLFGAFFAGSICISAIPFLLYYGNIYWKIICTFYLAFLLYDRNSGESGGRRVGIDWVRSLRVWKYVMDYFPVDLVKTAELTPNKNYLICIFPHGILSYGAAVNFGTSYSKWSTFFPGVRPKLTTLNVNTLLPLTRELILGCGLCSSTSNSLHTLLRQSNDPFAEENRDGYSSNAVGLIVGGARETFYTYPDTYRCVIRKRRGFIRIALETGASLVPAISFGENNVYDMIDIRPGFWRRCIENACMRYANRVPAFYNGRGIFQSKFGLLPKRHPITTVVGAPIHLKKITNPTDEDINHTFDLFCTHLKQLFESHKTKYIKQCESIHLEIV